MTQIIFRNHQKNTKNFNKNIPIAAINMATASLEKCMTSLR